FFTRLRKCASTKSSLAGEQFIKETAKRPDIGPLVNGSATGLFGTHVGGSTGDMPCARLKPCSLGRKRQFRLTATFPKGFGQPEVQHLHAALRRYSYVAGFQIAVNDSLSVRRFERLGDLTGVLQSLIHGQWTAQALAFDQFQDQARDS